MKPNLPQVFYPPGWLCTASALPALFPPNSCHFLLFIRKSERRGAGFSRLSQEGKSKQNGSPIWISAIRVPHKNTSNQTKSNLNKPKQNKSYFPLVFFPPILLISLFLSLSVFFLFFLDSYYYKLFDWWCLLSTALNSLLWYLLGHKGLQRSMDRSACNLVWAENRGFVQFTPRGSGAEEFKVIWEEDI